jgi:hypothetical protein
MGFTSLLLSRIGFITNPLASFILVGLRFLV